MNDVDQLIYLTLTVFISLSFPLHFSLMEFPFFLFFFSYLASVQKRRSRVGGSDPGCALDADRAHGPRPDEEGGSRQARQEHGRERRLVEEVARLGRGGKDERIEVVKDLLLRMGYCWRAEMGLQTSGLEG